MHTKHPPTYPPTHLHTHERYVLSLLLGSTHILLNSFSAFALNKTLTQSTSTTRAAKSRGRIVTVSEFLSEELGPLRIPDLQAFTCSACRRSERSDCQHRDARVAFYAGKNGEGYFDASQLYEQVELAIDIFVAIHKDHRIGVFLFDHSTLHSAKPKDAVLVKRFTLADKVLGEKDTPVRDGWVLANGQKEPFAFTVTEVGKSIQKGARRILQVLS